MKLFIDSANPEEVKKMWHAGIIDGVTTNPTLATKAGIQYKSAVQQIKLTHLLWPTLVVRHGLCAPRKLFSKMSRHKRRQLMRTRINLAHSPTRKSRINFMI